MKYFIIYTLFIGGILFLNCSRKTGIQENIFVSDLPLKGKTNSFYTSNRPPLIPNPLIKLPLGSIKPKGWVLNQLKLMAEGMVGHLPELSRFINEKSGWWTFKTRGWEELPYWLKGYHNLAYILNDKNMVNEANKWLEAALKSQQPDGYFGPPENKKNHDHWPNMIMLFIFRSHYEITKDPRIITFMTKYFKWQLNIPRKYLLPESWQKYRGGDNLECVYWLYNHTGEPFLLELAKAIHEKTANWTDGIPTPHGVNICMGIREPGVYYQQSKEKRHIEAVERNYNTVMSEYGQVPGGMFAADENYREGYTGATQAAETCSMVEFMYSFESLIKITGEAKYADRIENIAFNSLPAAIMPNFKGLHYLTAPNLVQCDSGGIHNFQNTGTMLSFSPWKYRCCQHNVSQGWPYYSEHLWMATRNNGLAAILYAPSEVNARVGSGTKVTILEDTYYPFDEVVNFTIKTPEPVEFPLIFRIPGWCQNAKIYVNNKLKNKNPKPDNYVIIERLWKNNDRIKIIFPMKITLTLWKKVANSISINRGPLTYSLKIGENWKRCGGTDEWPEFEVFPSTPWNYGLIVNTNNPESSFKVVKKKGKMPFQPFESNSVPIELHGKGNKIPNWTLVNNCAGKLQKSPVKSDEKVEDIVLIPMGAAHLRISSFPTIGKGPDANEWKKVK